MLNSLSIRFKLGVALIILTGLTLVVGIVNYASLKTLEQSGERFAANFMQAQSAILNADRDLYQAIKAQQDALLFGNKDNMSSFKESFDENAQQALDRMNVYREQMADYPEILSQLNGFDSKYKAWQGPASKTFSLILSGKSDEAKSMFESLEGAFSTLRDDYDKAGELLAEKSESLHLETLEISQSRQNLDVVVSVISVVIGIFLIVVVPKSIAGSINAIKVKVDDISQGEGDLVSRIPVNSKDELGQLAVSFNHLLDQLQSLIKDVVNDVGELGSNTSHLQEISHKTESISNNQTSQLSSLSHSFTEISHAVGDISSNAQNTASKSHEALTAAQSGLSQLDKTIRLNQDLSASVQSAGDKISQLSADSEQITSVLDVIRNIADQTNLLALNAAIEAARAGEQGRGFAVVADEVRTLAQRTQDSTEHIQSMIEALKGGVETTKTAMDKGCELMGDSLTMTEDMRHTFEEIQQLVTVVQEMNSQIAVGTDQQNNVMSDVNSGVDRLQSLTGEQGDVASSVAQTGDSVARLSKQLSNRVSKFKV